MLALSQASHMRAKTLVEQKWKDSFGIMAALLDRQSELTTSAMDA
jgi:hypothetical protein